MKMRMQKYGVKVYWLLIICILAEVLGGVCGTALPVPAAQVWDVDRLIRARNPGAVFSTTDRSTTTWKTLRSITYNPEFEAGSVGSASVEEASLVRRVRPTKESSSANSAATAVLPSIWCSTATTAALMGFAIGLALLVTWFATQSKQRHLTTVLTTICDIRTKNTVWVATL